ncbi:MAG: bifunctional hydroxymethylpyrimidine kinase/phosphomethylpyrimidine kinase [Cyanobacteria bacterium P01_E01_bin.35]
MTQIALTIAGSDSAGGAGIQADLKTFAMHQVHGTSVLTCVTAQSTVGVFEAEPIKLSLIKAQIDVVAADLKPDAVKTGMLFNSETITQVTQRLKHYALTPLVVDPVMVSRTGSKLIDDQAITCLQEQLIPLATILTPNRYEAEILSGLKIDNLEQLKQAAIAIFHSSGAKVILAKGGSLAGTEQGMDIWYDGKSIKTLFNRTVTTQNNNGTGCTLSAAICANLALGQDLWQSVVNAKKYVTLALENSLNVGAGNGPLGHFFPLLKSD